MIVYFFCNQEKKSKKYYRLRHGAYSAREGMTSGRAALGSSVARILPYPGHQRPHLRWQPRWVSSSLRRPGRSKDLPAPWRSLSHFRSVVSPTPTINSVSVSPISLHMLVAETTTDAAQMVNWSLAGRSHYWAGLWMLHLSLYDQMSLHRHLALLLQLPLIHYTPWTPHQKEQGKLYA